MVASKKFIAAAVWACCATAVAGVAYQSRAEAMVPADALQCEEGDLVKSTVLEPLLEVPGAATPREALVALTTEYGAEDVAGLQAVEQANDHATFARTVNGKQRFVAKLFESGGWRVDAGAACVTPRKGGHS